MKQHTTTIWLIVCVLHSMDTQAEMLIPPSIVREPTPHTQYLATDQDLRLQCEATGTPSPSIQWYVNGEPIDVSRLERCASVNMNTPGQLTLRPESGRCATHEEYEATLAGHYQCRASNPAGTAFSHVTDLQWAFIKFRSHGAAEDRRLVVPEGGALRLTCSEIESNPFEQTTFSWEYQEPGETDWTELRVSTQDTTKWTKTDTLIFLRVTGSDAGQYRCRGRNAVTGGTQIDQEVWTLTVHPDTDENAGQSGRATVQDLLSSPPVMTIEKDNTAIIKCFHFGTPSVEVNWGVLPQEECPDPGVGETFHDIQAGSVNSAGGRTWYNKSQRVLILNKIQIEQEGCYQCTAHRTGDNSFYIRRIYLSVAVSPEAEVTDFADKTISPGSSRAFGCAVAGNPAPLITWYLNGTAHDPGMHPNWRVSSYAQSIMVTGAELKDTGVITCNATNTWGSSIASTHLVVTPDSQNINTVLRNPPIVARSVDTRRHGQPSHLDSSELHVKQGAPRLVHADGEKAINWEIVLPVILCACLVSAVVSGLTVFACLRRRRLPKLINPKEASQPNGDIAIDDRTQGVRLRRSLSVEAARMLKRAPSMEEARYLQRLASVFEDNDSS